MASVVAAADEACLILLDIALNLCYFSFEKLNKAKLLSLQKGIPAAIGFRLETA
jgi:hypothetical protein